MQKIRIKIWGDKPVSSKMKRAELVVYKPKENPSGISVIVCPGGSYCYLGRKVEGVEIAKWLNQNNITAFVLYYRVGWFGNHHPAMIQDLQRTMQFVKENSETYSIDPEKVGVMGFSAGGHLVGTASAYFDINFLEELNITPQVSQRPAFTAMIYPVISMTNDSIVHKKSRKNLLTKTYPPELAQMMSLENNVRPDMPPVFLIQCAGDKTVDYRNAENYAVALKKKNVPHFYKLYHEQGHGFGIRKGKGEARQWHQWFMNWLKNI
jgi:acetyl esterase/lipase